MVVYAETALEKDAPTASDLAHQEVAGISMQINRRSQVTAVDMHVLLVLPVFGQHDGPTSQQVTPLAMFADDDDDDETCGFCIFMKAGGCKDEFKVRSTNGVLRHNKLLTWRPAMQAWSKCVDDERKDGNDFTEECKDRVQSSLIHITNALHYGCKCNPCT